MTDVQRAVLSDVSIPRGRAGCPKCAACSASRRGAGPWPGVLLLYETFGVDGVMRWQAQRMAAGCRALMPYLFTAGGARRSLVPTFRAVAAGEGRPFVGVEAARSHLAEMSSASDKTSREYAGHGFLHDAWAGTEAWVSEHLGGVPPTRG